MADFTENIVNQRFREVYSSLEKNSIIKGKSDIANKLGTYNHVINSILKGKRNITVDQLSKLFDHYNVNSNYLFGLSKEMFMEGGMEQFGVETMLKSEQVFGKMANISLLDKKVRAGDTIEFNSPTYVENLPKFSLPNISGTNLFAFEVDGESMMPTLTHGDLIVCEYMERDTPIYDNHIYVIVTNSFVTKRVQQIKHGQELKELRLISDNHQVYQAYNIPIEEVNQLLKVRCRLTSYAIS